jgi:hypothetical protein
MARVLGKLTLWLGTLLVLLWGVDQAYPYLPKAWQRWVGEQHLMAYEHLVSVRQSLD